MNRLANEKGRIRSRKNDRPLILPHRVFYFPYHEVSLTETTFD